MLLIALACHFHLHCGLGGNVLVHAGKLVTRADKQHTAATTTATHCTLQGDIKLHQ